MKTLAVLREYQPRILVINASVHRGDIAQMDAVAGIAASFGATAVSFKPITSTGRSGVDTSFFLDETLLHAFELRETAFVKSIEDSWRSMES